MAVEEFYRKYRSEMNYDSYKGRRFVKFLERAIAEDHRMQEVELDFPSAEFYEEQELQRDKEEESVKMALSNSGREGDSSNVDVG